MDAEASTPNKLEFRYEKGRYFRMIHVDGAYGSIGPSARYLHMSLWNERRTIPRKHVFGVQAGGRIDTELAEVEDVGGIFREIEVCAVMDIPTVRALHKWLGEKLTEHESITNAAHKHHKPSDR